jgi:hypothetical protein
MKCIRFYVLALIVTLVLSSFLMFPTDVMAKRNNESPNGVVDNRDDLPKGVSNQPDGSRKNQTKNQDNPSNVVTNNNQDNSPKDDKPKPNKPAPTTSQNIPPPEDKPKPKPKSDNSPKVDSDNTQDTTLQKVINLLQTSTETFLDGVHDHHDGHDGIDGYHDGSPWYHRSYYCYYPTTTYCRYPSSYYCYYPTTT